MPRGIRIFDCADLSKEDSFFVNIDEIDGRDLTWRRFSGLPKNVVERIVKRPRLSRYRAAYGCAIQAAVRGDILISHIPLMSAALESARSVGLRLPPHLAFSFNFLELPGGARRRWQERMFQNVAQFCVYSAYEAELYSSHFNLPRGKFRPVLWTQPAPQARRSPQSGRLRPLVCAVGSQGRDFATLIAAARRLPDVEFLVIASPPANLSRPPDNVSFKFGISTDEVWRLAGAAEAIVIPLLSESTCCGQITIVSAQQCAMPVITTSAHATREYTEDAEATRLVPAGDVDALARAIERAIDERDALMAAAERDRVRLTGRYDRKSWEDYVSTFIRDHI